MPVATGHQYGVARREGTGLTVAHAGLGYVGALAGALAVTSYSHIEG